MALTLQDVSHSVGPEPLVPRNGSLQPPDANESLSANLYLFRLPISGPNWPGHMRDISVTASLWPRNFQGQTIWLATIVFMNDNFGDPTYGFGRTYRVTFEHNAEYDSETHDDDLQERLRAEVASSTN